MADINFGLNILPKTNSAYNLGSSTQKWNIYANTINGTSVESIISGSGSGSSIDVQINSTSIVSNGVANIPIADGTNFGVVKVRNGADGVKIDGSNYLSIEPAADAYLQAGANNYKVITPYNQHQAIYYGLAKLAGTDLANETVTVGTYPTATKTAIKTMLGVTDPTVSDVQIDGTSILNNGVANIPHATSSSLGLVKPVAGLYVDPNTGSVSISAANDAQVKAGKAQYYPLTPYREHMAMFYGMAKAAGDTTQASSSNAVGVYTSQAKTAIQNMLGIENAVTFIQEVSGTVVSITGEPNYKYVCGEVYSISITAPASGTIDVWFTCGSSPAALTTSGVIFPEWFDPEDLDADTIYEILITDGYGGVAKWEIPVIT